jgi:hypothetical protein
MAMAMGVCGRGYYLMVARKQREDGTGNERHLSRAHPSGLLSLSKPHFLSPPNNPIMPYYDSIKSNTLIRSQPSRSNHFLKAHQLPTKPPKNEFPGDISYPIPKQGGKEITAVYLSWE